MSVSNKLPLYQVRLEGIALRQWVRARSSSSVIPAKAGIHEE